MKELIENLQKWLKRNRVDDSSTDAGDSRKRERHWYTRGKRDAGREPKPPSCLYCQGDHWGEACGVFDTIEKRRNFFHERRLCYNCGREGHGASYCRSRPCFKCKSRHHTSLCDRHLVNGASDGTVFTAYNPGSEDRSLPAIIPLKIQGITLWAYLDTGSGRNFISREAIEKLNLKPMRHESRQFVTINGVQKQSLPLFEVRLYSLDHRTSERVEITGSKMADFTAVRRPTVKELKTRYEHARDKQFYVTASEEYPIHVILGDRTYCKIRTDQTFKGRPEIVREQLEEGIVEVAPKTPTGDRTFYMPHKPVVRESASTTKVRMVFDASAKPHLLANSINECMYTGPPLQPLLCLNDGPSFPQPSGWTVWSPCIGSEIQENLGKFSYQTESRRRQKLPARQGSAGSIVQQGRIWQTWEAEELEFTRWREEGGLQVLNGY